MPSGLGEEPYEMETVRVDVESIEIFGCDCSDFDDGDSCIVLGFFLS